MTVLFDERLERIGQLDVERAGSAGGGTRLSFDRLRTNPLGGFAGGGRGGGGGDHGVADWAAGLYRNSFPAGSGSRYRLKPVQSVKINTVTVTIFPKTGRPVPGTAAHGVMRTRHWAGRAGCDKLRRLNQPLS